MCYPMLRNHMIPYRKQLILIVKSSFINQTNSCVELCATLVLFITSSQIHSATLCICCVMKNFVYHNKKVAPNSFLNFSNCTIGPQLETS